MLAAHQRRRHAVQAEGADAELVPESTSFAGPTSDAELQVGHREVQVREEARAPRHVDDRTTCGSGPPERCITALRPLWRHVPSGFRASATGAACEAHAARRLALSFSSALLTHGGRPSVPSDLAEADGAQESAGGGGGGERRLEGEASTLSVGSGRPDVQARLAQRKNSTES